MSIDISLIVPTYQRSASVVRLLKSVSGQTLSSHQFEVIVVIDGSTDSTLEMLEKFPAKYLLRTISQSNRGRASACNRGIRAAAGKVIVLLDDDMEPQPGFLAAHLECHLQAENIGLMGAVPIKIGENSEPIQQYSALKFNTHLEKLSQLGSPIQLRDFYSGNFSIRRENLMKVGLFDEQFKVYGNEDLDLYIRLTQSGVKFIYSAEAIALQYNDKDFFRLACDNLEKGKTALLLAQKHPETINEQKLGMRNSDSTRWRTARGFLLWLSQRIAPLPQLLFRLIRQLERVNPPNLFGIYRFTLDYYFWLGAQDDKNRVVLHR